MPTTGISGDDEIRADGGELGNIEEGGKSARVLRSKSTKLTLLCQNEHRVKRSDKKGKHDISNKNDNIKRITGKRSQEGGSVQVTFRRRISDQEREGPLFQV